MASYSASRILGGLRRRRKDLARKLMYRPGAKKLQNSVLFEAFEGKVIGDSPLDIFLELQRKRSDLTCYWSYRRSTLKNGAKIPLGAIGVRHGSRRWLKLLATSKYLVNNTAFPWYFKKSAGQIYLQTWHGTPLKRLVRDIAPGQLSGQYLATMQREAQAWDYLVSPSDYASKVFESAFGYRGQMLETGYPRNDRVVRASAETRVRVRKQLGVSPATILVLYAPTWRDYSINSLGDFRPTNYLDASTQLPRGFQMMYRGHTMTHAAHTKTSAGDAIDVTNYPDITELFLAADVLITDYSSVMFDFANTKKPIIFLTPDIEKYESERGFYLDLRNDAPGPICSNTAEVIDALEDLEGLQKIYESNYRAWQEKFVGLDDGGAAIRVVAKVFGSSLI